MPREVIKVMVSSTIYGFQKELNQLCSTIEGYKSREYEYEVLNSHIGSIYVAPGASTIEACLQAVSDCDFFLGIILPRYGSGLTHEEFLKAIELDKPRGFLSHFSVRYARELLAQYMYKDTKQKVKNTKFQFKSTLVFEDIRIIDMYNDAIQATLPFDQRRWAHEFGHHDGDEMSFVETEFKNINRLKADLDQLAKNKAKNND
jgi:Domain of unknown function (DUF4062)